MGEGVFIKKILRGVVQIAEISIDISTLSKTENIISPEERKCLVKSIGKWLSRTNAQLEKLQIIIREHSAVKKMENMKQLETICTDVISILLNFQKLQKKFHRLCLQRIARFGRTLEMRRLLKTCSL
jgi:hypothetical protein